MKGRHDSVSGGVRFRVDSLSNGSFVATFLGAAPSNFSGDIQDLVTPKKAYDDTGALYYVIIVVFIYGFSIILMIGSLIKRSEADTGVVYMKEMEKLRRVERRREKFKTRLIMSQRRVQNVLKSVRPDADAVSVCSDRPSGISANNGSGGGGGSGWDSTSFDWTHPGSAKRFYQGSSWSLVSGGRESDVEESSHLIPQTILPPTPSPTPSSRSDIKPDLKIDIPDDCEPTNVLLNAALCIPFLPELSRAEKTSSSSNGETNPTLSVEGETESGRHSVSSAVTPLDTVEEVEEEAFCA